MTDEELFLALFKFKDGWKERIQETSSKRHETVKTKQHETKSRKPKQRTSVCAVSKHAYLTKRKCWFGSPLRFKFRSLKL